MAAGILAIAAFGGGSAKATSWFADPNQAAYVDGDTAYFIFDYTVPPDGLDHVWSYELVSDDPTATLAIDYPSETFALFTYGGGGDSVSLAVDYTFKETVRPHRTDIVMQAPASFNDCNAATPTGELCGADYNVWGNGSFLKVTSHSPVWVTQSAYTTNTRPIAAPEPAVWMSLIAGFGMLGAALRRRRAGQDFRGWGTRTRT